MKNIVDFLGLLNTPMGKNSVLSNLGFCSSCQCILQDPGIVQLDKEINSCVKSFFMSHWHGNKCNK